MDLIDAICKINNLDKIKGDNIHPSLVKTKFRVVTQEKNTKTVAVFSPKK